MHAMVFTAAIVWIAFCGPHITLAENAAALTVRTAEWRGDTICVHRNLRCGSAAAGVETAKSH